VAQIHLVIGPVGAGKSTFALQLARDHAAIRLNLDEWIAVLFSPDRPEDRIMEWYVERTQRCLEQIWRLTTRTIAIGTDVVLEIGLIQRRDRERLYRRVDDLGLRLVIHVLDAPRELRRARVELRNREQGETFSMVVPARIFDLASDMWEPPDESECRGRDIRFISTATP
jgi:predicted kinase